MIIIDGGVIGQQHKQILSIVDHMSEYTLVESYIMIPKIMSELMLAKEQSREDRSYDNALSFSDSEDKTVNTIQSSIDSCSSNHLLENSSDKVQSYSEKIRGSQKSKSVLLPEPNDVVSYIPVDEEIWHKL